MTSRKQQDRSTWQERCRLDSLTTSEPPLQMERRLCKRSINSNQEVQSSITAAATLAVFAWIALIVLVATTMKPIAEAFPMAADSDRFPAASAMAIVLVSSCLFLVRFLLIPLDIQVVHKQRSSNKKDPEIATLLTLGSGFSGQQREAGVPWGVVYATLVVQGITASTQGILAFSSQEAFFTVWDDPKISNTGILVLRLCAWVPLGGLLTYLTETVDLESGDLRIAVCTSLSMSIVPICGLLLPSCTNPLVWCFVICLAACSGGALVARIRRRRRAYIASLRSQAEGGNARKRFAYHLTLALGALWTGFALMYIVERNPTIEAVFDVLASVVYMRLLWDAHMYNDGADAVPSQMRELRHAMDTVCGLSSDAVVISMQRSSLISQPSLCTSIFSPNFLSLVEDENDVQMGKGKSKTSNLVLDTQPLQKEGRRTQHLQRSLLLDTDENLSSEKEEPAALQQLDKQDLVVQQALNVVNSIWRRIPASSCSLTDSGSETFRHEMITSAGHIRDCLVRMTPYCQGRSLVAVVQDDSDRQRCQRAEHIAQNTALARLKDANDANRFTRHLIKNGLLEGIELLNSLQAANNQTRASGPSRDITGYVDELQCNLKEMLAKVLIEATMRDIIHDSYVPNWESVAIQELLNKAHPEMGSERFPVNARDTLPTFSLDPQLFECIHRNAIANAQAYGKPGGVVRTEVHWNCLTSELQLRVFNEPGPHHDKLLGLSSQEVESVFHRATRLSVHQTSHDHNLAPGDGAWVMQKCAMVLGGKCQLIFQEQGTTLCFNCRPMTISDTNASKETTSITCVLDDCAAKARRQVWGIAIAPQSHSHHMLMEDLLDSADIAPSHRLNFGTHPTDVTDVVDALSKHMKSNKENNHLVLISEQLVCATGPNKTIEGGEFIQMVLDRLPRVQQSRIVTLLCNTQEKDSGDNIRFHPAPPERCSAAAVTSENLSKTLTEFWDDKSRSFDMCLQSSTSSSTEYAPPTPRNNGLFADISNKPVADIQLEEPGNVVDFKRGAGPEHDGEPLLDRHDIAEPFEYVETLLENKATNQDWKRLWNALHSLKGDLMMFQGCEDISNAASLIGGMRGQYWPSDFDSQWDQVRLLIRRSIPQA